MFAAATNRLSRRIWITLNGWLRGSTAKTTTRASKRFQRRLPRTKLGTATRPSRASTTVRRAARRSSVFSSLPLDPRAAQFACHRALPRRQVVVSCVTRTECLSATATRFTKRVCRSPSPAWSPPTPTAASQVRSTPGDARSSDPRRLGTGSVHCQLAARSSGDRQTL